MELLQPIVLLANEHHTMTRRNVTNDFRINNKVFTVQLFIPNDCMN